MRLLLDTHIFLWYIVGDKRISAFVRATIENADSVYVSVASLWEATIKYRLGKLALPEPPHPWLATQREEHGFASLVIDEASVAHLSSLELYHRDPFDRILIC
jgi:PIN domain nuclease of toxin-antitoxin system